MKACPFCGSKSVELTYCGQRIWYARCLTCCAGGPTGVNEEQAEDLWEKRDGPIRVCTRCGGYGERAYPSTSTYRGGIGGQMITQDVCDKCWGSGDEAKPYDRPKMRK